MLPTDVIITIPTPQESGIPAARYASQAQCELYSPRAQRVHIPYYIKNRVRMMDDDKKSHSEIIEKIKELYNIILTDAQVTSIITNEKGRSIKDITPKCLEYLEEHKAYVKNGFIYVDDGTPLKHRLSTGITKQTEVNGCLFVTKYLVAVIMGVDVCGEIVIGHKDRDYRNTNFENLEIVKLGQGVSAITHRLSMKDTEILAKAYADAHGDPIKTWIDAFENSGLSVSANTLYAMSKANWKRNVCEKYYSKEDVIKWHKEDKYLRYVDLTPERDTEGYVEPEDVPEQLTLPEEKPVEKPVIEKKPASAVKDKPVAVMAPRQLTSDDIRYNELNQLNLTKKKKLGYSDKKFVIQYTAKQKIHTMSMFDVLKDLKDSGFDYQIGLIKNVLQDLTRGK